ncbi:putative neuronal acetylcholine receptor subunit alpha-10 [Apostichopus japonicus]|uniref:Putative neuronal acetylcholine receptor subunit alpha-10 n=1 Tax=Stichopus japonicus TaxID=307972 RepID=A0A2G8K2E9_STIJA|nr:putative neuronal acetylcholine receptor subunit alpha-10 [Apostichopus japonicus]
MLMTVNCFVSNYYFNIFLILAADVEAKLIDDLLSQYSRYVRPVAMESQLVEIFYHMKLSRILKIDERNQILATAVWLEQWWHDDYLKWNPEDYDNLTEVTISSRRIWIPDTVLYNSADVDKEPGTGVLLTNAVINYTGGVYWPAPAIFKSSCSLVITRFPFDEQTCILKFGPWAYLGNEVIMRQVSESGDFSQLTPNGQWKLLAMPVEENLVKYGCCPIPFSDITFTLELRRKELFYLFNLVIPSILMSWLSVLSFYMPMESGEKVGLNITVLLALVFFLLLGASLLPPNADSVPLLAQLLECIIVIMCLETAMSVIVLRLYYREPKTTPPRWLRWLVLDKLADILFMHGRRHPFRDYDDADIDEGLAAIQDPFDPENGPGSIDDRIVGKSLLEKLALQESVAKETQKGEDSDYESDSGLTDAIGGTVKQIERCVSRLMEHAQETDRSDSVKQQWLDICIIFDRILLIAFTLALVMTSVIVLFLMVA